MRNHIEAASASVKSGQFTDAIRHWESINFYGISGPESERLFEIAQQIPRELYSHKFTDGLVMVLARSGRIEAARQLAFNLISERRANFQTYFALSIIEERSVKSFRHFREALDAAFQLARSDGELFAYYTEDIYYWIIQLDPLAARKSINEARKLIGNRVDRLVLILGLEIRVLLQTGDFKSGYALFEQMNIVAETTNTPVDLRDAQEAVAEGLKDTGELDKALHLIDPLTQKVGEDIGYALYVKAAILLDMGKYDESLLVFDESLSVLRHFDRRLSQILPLVFIPYILWILNRLEDFDKAIDRLEYFLAGELDDEAKDSEMSAFYPLALGIKQLKSGSRFKAIETLENIRRIDTYDSVLFSFLLACQLRFEEGMLEEKDITRLVDIAYRRANANPFTLKIWVLRRHRELAEYCVTRNWRADFFRGCISSSQRFDVMFSLLESRSHVLVNKQRIDFSIMEATVALFLIDQMRLGVRADSISAGSLVLSLGKPMSTCRSLLSRVKRKISLYYPQLLGPPDGFYASLDFEDFFLEVKYLSWANVVFRFKQSLSIMRILDSENRYLRARLDTLRTGLLAEFLSQSKDFSLAALFIVLVLDEEGVAQHITLELFKARGPDWLLMFVSRYVHSGHSPEVLEYALRKLLRHPDTLHL